MIQNYGSSEIQQVQNEIFNLIRLQASVLKLDVCTTYLLYNMYCHLQLYTVWLSQKDETFYVNP